MMWFFYRIYWQAMSGINLVSHKINFLGKDNLISNLKKHRSDLSET